MERKKNIFDEYFQCEDRRGSKFRGITWHKTNKKWLSSISHNKKRVNLGYYEDEETAAQAYDVAVLKYKKPILSIRDRPVALLNSSAHVLTASA